ncbi:hypothetical protein [Vallitalea guaymasensis]|uniref:hypothetical protein n=1 Tax=Vallitalea guaymasensis TaxID=1185412 RepID=UPI0023540B1F|nr:hypothetical protein [Vallitalea guaymasensis]
MLQHLGARVQEKSGGMKLGRDNYVDITKFKSRPAYYSEAIIENTRRLALLNLDINLKFFKNLNNHEFKRVVDEFAHRSDFEEITDLDKCKGASGYYLLVFDEYSQVYIGIAKDIKRRVTSHWSKQIGLDRMIFGDAKNSKISVDSFRALDTTRIFVKVDSNPAKNEDSYIDLVPSEFSLNRTKGGNLSGGLAEAIAGKKSNNILNSYDNEDLYTEIKELLVKRKELMGIARETKGVAVEGNKRNSIKKVDGMKSVTYSKRANDKLKVYLVYTIIVAILGLILLFNGQVL